jgi:hypothetical protein
MSNQPVGSDSTFRDEWLEGAAKAFFATAYADYVEEGHSTDNELSEDERETRLSLSKPGPGEDWMDYLPEIPPNAYALAGELWAMLEAANPGGCGVYTLAERAEAVDGEKPDPEQFGHYLAMQAMGHGVSWFDDHKTFKIKVPSIECSQCSFADEAYAPPKPAKRRRG